MSYTRGERQPTSWEAPLISKTAEQFLENLAKSLQIPDSRYEEADQRYKSVGAWLKRPESTLRLANPVVHSQGSFALGTVIKPVSEREDYDIDMMCVFEVDRGRVTQESLKNGLKYELAAYAKRYSMEEPESHRRCVRLNYAVEAQFHLDATPAVPDGERQRNLLEAGGLDYRWADLAVAITDEEHPRFKSLGHDWPHSNPRGYSKWFRSRMQTVFDMRRQAMRLAENRATIEDIPEYRVKTPLQSAIQILKRHRDMTHEGEPKDRPISIIINTLSALAYNQESTIYGALYSILSRMDKYIERRGGIAWIPNPTDPLENFADKWAENPDREKAFYDWLEKARTDFIAMAGIEDRKTIGEIMSPVLGPKLVESAVNHRIGSSSLSEVSKKWNLLNPDHKQPVPWQQTMIGKVDIKKARFLRNGFRWQDFESGGRALPKHCELVFEAETNVRAPYSVYWQIVNTGSDASKANGLRGRFEEGRIEEGKLMKKESTLYKGTHTIECFVVKNNYCVARSEPFIVNIQ